MKPIHRGDKGSAVVELQAMLYEHGFLPRALEPRELGVFGAGTHSAVTYFQQCNRGPDGDALTVDGWVGDATWWALKHLDIARLDTDTTAQIPARLSTKRIAVLKAGLAFHAKGVREVPNGSNRGPFVDECIPKYLTKDSPPGPAWCCYAAFAIAKQGIGAFPLGAHIGSCYRAYVLAKARGQLRTKPTPGDIFLMLHRDENGALTRRGHAGIVLRADADRINTLEGNCGNRYALSLRQQSTIAGYIDFYGETSSDAWERGVIAAASAKGLRTR